MTIAADASVVVAALVDDGPQGRTCEELLASEHLVAPHLLPVEVTNVLRRATAAGDITADVAALAFGDLLDLRMDLYAFEPFAARVWELRANVSAYEAWYVALAETLDLRLATLDARLARAPGPRCDIVVPRG